MHDPYVYPNTDILKNKYNIKNEAYIKEMEAEFTSLRLKQIKETPIKGNYDFQHLCEFHRRIFQDIYDWAGQPRSINIVKEEAVLGGISVEYSDYQAIKEDTNNVLKNMKNIDWSILKTPEKAEALALNMSQLWKIHPFREGNTRTTVTFCNQFAQSKGMFLDVELFKNYSSYMRNALVAAASIFKDLGDISKPDYLIKIVQDAMEKGNKEMLKPRPAAGKKRSSEIER